MTFSRALAYFFLEALQSMKRSWRVSLVAVLTIAVSLFLGGIFLLVSSNLQRQINLWQSEGRVIVYLEKAVDSQQLDQLRATLENAPWVGEVELVGTERARARFGDAFPGMADLLDGWDEEPLPASLEASISDRAADPERVDRWLEELKAANGVSMVDDDRYWLDQLQTAVLVLRGFGLLVGVILLGTAVFTISSIIRLTAYLYREEISVMRLVGATEFFIRGPFYAEGLLQGTAGGAIAALALWLGHRGLLGSDVPSFTTSVLAHSFLSPAQTTALIVLGALAGLFGAVTSLEREALEPPPAATDPS